MRVKIALALIVAIAFAAGAVSSAFTLFGRTAVVQSGALRMQDGTLQDRYQAIYIVDTQNPTTCLFVLRDAQTEHFTTTQVDPGSCR